MTISVRFVTVFLALLLVSTTATAQLPTAPPPRLALDELVKEYKWFGLPLPPPNAELVRVGLNRFRGSTYPDELGFRLPPTKPGDGPSYLIGPATETVVTGAELVKPDSDALKGVRPEYVSDLLCLAVQCRVRGWNEFAELLYSRAREAIHTPVPEETKPGLLPGTSIRVNGWALHAEDSSVSKELRLAAEKYWHPQVTSPDSDRVAVLRYLKVLYPEGHDDIRELEQTLAPRKSKPGTVEALIDDLIDWAPDGWTGKQERGGVAYWKLVELGFDAVPALLEHVGDERLTRYEVLVWNVKLGPIDTSRVRVRHVVGQILNDLSGRELVNQSGLRSVDAEKARTWWGQARKEGEEKWLVAHAVPEYGPDTNRVVFRVLGAKYPARLSEFYRTVLSKSPFDESHVLANEIAASKLSRAEKLVLLGEGAEHNRLAHRLAALTVLARFDPPLFRKHLLATLQKLPPGVEKRRASYGKFAYPQVELATLVWTTDDPAHWDALAALAKQSKVEVRIEILRGFGWLQTTGKPTRRELVRFLLRFMSDESAPQFFSPDGEEQMGESVRDIATEVLARELELKTEFYRNRDPLARFFIRAAIGKAAAVELTRLKN